MDVTGLSAEQKGEVEQAIAELRAICRAVEVPEPERAEWLDRVRSLELVSELASIELIDAFFLHSRRSENAPGQPMYLLVSGVRAGHPGAVTTCHLVMAPMGIDGGHVSIRPERARDVIADWFRHVDVDFEGAPEFSDRYYVRAESPERFRAAIDLEILRTIGRFPDLHVELVSSTLAATTAGPLRTADVSRLVGLALEIAGRASRRA